MSLDPTRRFDAAAEIYSRARPAYPEEATSWLVEAAGLPGGARVLDLAAGTGALTAPLVRAGLEVTAIEPSEEMRRELAANAPGAEILDGVAEHLPVADASVELVTVANALHWFQPEIAYAEISRVLRPSGHLAVLWNVEDRADPLSRRIDDLKQEFLSASPIRGPHEGEALEWEAFFEDHEVREFRFVHRPPSVADYISSWSLIANMTPAEREAVLARVGEWAPSGPIDLPFRVEVTLGRRRDTTPLPDSSR